MAKTGTRKTKAKTTKNAKAIKEIEDVQEEEVVEEPVVEETEENMEVSAEDADETTADTNEEEEEGDEEEEEEEEGGEEGDDEEAKDGEAKEETQADKERKERNKDVFLTHPETFGTGLALHVKRDFDTANRSNHYRNQNRHKNSDQFRKNRQRAIFGLDAVIVFGKNENFKNCNTSSLSWASSKFREAIHRYRKNISNSDPNTYQVILKVPVELGTQVTNVIKWIHTGRILINKDTFEDTVKSILYLYVKELREMLPELAKKINCKYIPIKENPNNRRNKDKKDDKAKVEEAEVEKEEVEEEDTTEYDQVFDGNKILDEVKKLERLVWLREIPKRQRNKDNANNKRRRDSNINDTKPKSVNDAKKPKIENKTQNQNNRTQNNNNNRNQGQRNNDGRRNQNRPVNTQPKRNDIYRQTTYPSHPPQGHYAAPAPAPYQAPYGAQNYAQQPYGQQQQPYGQQPAYGAPAPVYQPPQQAYGGNQNYQRPAQNNGNHYGYSGYN